MSEESTGIVTGLIAGYYDVATAQGLIRTRARGNFRKQKLKPQVGDRVTISVDDDRTGYLLQVAKRRNLIGRPAVANVDHVLLVISAKEPDFSLELLDRYLTFFSWKQVAVSVYLSKTDLVADRIKSMQKQLSYYEKYGYQVYFDKSKLKQKLLDEPAAVWTLAGQSGAGKSTLINFLLPDIKQETAAISTSLNRGKHTTRKVELFKLGQLLLADTPGFSALDFSPLKLDDLRNCFVEFSYFQNQCKFRSCQHLREPGCQVKAAVANHKIASWRYQHYLNIRNEIEEGRIPEYLK